MNYSLNIGEWNSVFAVPSSVVDKYIKLASGNSLKLLLYLLRNSGKEISEDKLREELGFVETGELEDAALFWIQRGIIRYSKEEKGEFIASSSDEEPLPSQNNKSTTLSKTAVYVQQTLIGDIPEIKTPARVAPAIVDSHEIASRINTDAEIQMLFAEAEKMYARPLRPRDNQLIIALVDHYGLPSGVALMLLSYCFKVQKTAPNYIQTVAANWAEESIDSIEKANAKLLSLERQNGLEQRLREAMELTSGFTPKQKEYIAIWTEQWKFSEEMILLAYQNTVDQIGKWNVKYTHKILESWKNNGISNTAAAKASNAPYTQKKPVTQTTQRASSFDINDIMSKIKNQYKS